MANPLMSLIGNLILHKYSPKESYKSSMPELADLLPIQNLKKREGAIITIFGRPLGGKTICAYRLAEIIGRPTYAISPEQKPPPWIEELKISDIADKPPPYSTLIADDILSYFSSRDYNEPFAQAMESIIPAARHRRKLIVILVAQTSGLADKYGLRSDLVILRAPDLLYEDIERSSIKKLQDRAASYWEGKSEGWLQRHAYIVSYDYAGLCRVNLPGKPVYQSEDTPPISSD